MALQVELFDIVLSFDTTGSMEDCLHAVRERMREMLRKLKSDIPAIKLGVIAHGDYDTDHTYIIKYENLTDDVERLCNFVRTAQGTGGGHMNNLDEAYELALKYTRCHMSWRPNSNRVLVMIGDCRPHEKNYSLNSDRIDWTEEILKPRDMNVKINAVQCEGRSYADSFYQKIASATFGQHVTLYDIKEIEKTLMSICYREAGLGMSISANPMGYGVPLQNQQTVADTTILEPLAVCPTTLDSDFSDSDSDDDENQKGMICPMCKIAKPPNEYPSKSVTKECRHAPLECLRVTLNSAVDFERTCPSCSGCRCGTQRDSVRNNIFGKAPIPLAC